MLAYVVSEKRGIAKVPCSAKMVFFSRRPKFEDLVTLLQQCPRLERIDMSPSMGKCLSNTVKMAAEIMGITLSIGQLKIQGKKEDSYEFDAAT